MRGRRTDHAKVLERPVIVPLETPDEFALIRPQEVEPLRAVSDTRNRFELGLMSKDEEMVSGRGRLLLEQGRVGEGRTLSCAMVVSRSSLRSLCVSGDATHTVTQDV